MALTKGSCLNCGTKIWDSDTINETEVETQNVFKETYKEATSLNASFFDILSMESITVLTPI